MESKFLANTLTGSFLKAFITAVLTLYVYELTEGLDPFKFDLTILSKLTSAGMVSALPVLINYFNSADSRYGRKPKPKPFKPKL